MIDAQEQSRRRLGGIGFMIVAVFAFSIMDALMKRLTSTYAPLQIACLRSVSSLLCLAAWIAARRSWSSIAATSLGAHLLRGALGILLLSSFAFAVHRLTLAQSYSLFLAAPLLMTALSVPIHGEKVTVRRWIAIGCGLLGVLLVLQPWGAGAFSPLAAAAAGLATVCYSLSALTVRTVGGKNNALSLVFWYLLFVSIGAGALSLANWHTVRPADYLWWGGVGVSGALGQLWLTEAFRRAPPSVVGPFEYTAIVWAFAIDWVFWAATPSPSLVMGAGIVIASGMYVILDERRLAAAG